MIGLSSVVYILAIPHVELDGPMKMLNCLLVVFELVFDKPSPVPVFSSSGLKSQGFL